MKFWIILGSIVVFGILALVVRSLWKGEPKRDKNDFNPNADDHTNAQF